MLELSRLANMAEPMAPKTEYRTRFIVDPWLVKSPGNAPSTPVVAGIMARPVPIPAIDVMSITVLEAVLISRRVN